ncbi:hypothetical protein MKY92_25020 [Paenibacillus sp. FSL R5-0623]|uniref:Uncharacterized protein n=1 Tax=Paenibacillus xylanexedens TaxID=528191 RepID=A0ABS4RV18_PAEXY|nr:MULTISPECIES: hypothetical protein [Paenibacillus]MBP2246195.1 hypothetical protein [Paenibacillus xylanexedens]OMF64856.1 hypothetical protein BK141_10965 [Paenibacillus sp. FSL R5-0765]
MGKIALWGMQHGLGVTSATAALAAFIGLEYDVRTLVSQPQRTDGDMERFFNKTINQYNRQFFAIGGLGLDSLERVAKSSKLERNSVKNYTLMVERNRLDLLWGSERLNRPQQGSIEAVNMVFRMAAEYYGISLLDARSGQDNEVSNSLIRDADLVVICVNQNISVLEKYFDNQRKHWPEVLEEKPHLLLMTQYDPMSKYKIKNIANKYKLKAPILTIPYNTSFKDHLNDGDIKGFFARNRFVGSSHENHYFIQEVGRAAKTILHEIGINTKLKRIERGN